MSNLTPEIEERFYWLKEMCSGASKGEHIGPLMIRDKIIELEALVEDALTPKCKGCGEPMVWWKRGLDLCLDCFKNQQQKAARLCAQCGHLFFPGGPELMVCPDCIADWEAHIEEVERAHAATNGTL